MPSKQNVPERGILVNAVDDPPHCDFYVPSILKRNSLVLAISTGKKSGFRAPAAPGVRRNYHTCLW